MTHLLFSIGFTAILFFLARSRRAAQRAAPPEPFRDPPADEPVFRPVRAATRRRESILPPPVAKTARVRSSGYLLDGHREAGTDDATTAMMDMMAGPGVCSPRGRPSS